MSRRMRGNATAERGMVPLYPGNPMGMSARKPMPTAWWFRPVSRQARVGEQSDVTWKRLYRRPAAASASIRGVPRSDPKQPSCAKPRSSTTISTTLGAPAGGTGGGAKLAVDSAIVLPIFAVTAVPSHASRLERADVVAQPFGGFDGRLGPVHVDTVPDLGHAAPGDTRPGADELARHDVVAQRRPPLRLLLEQSSEHLLVALAVTVLGVEPDLEPLRRQQLHLVVLAAVARVPDLEVAARHP